MKTIALHLKNAFGSLGAVRPGTWVKTAIFGGLIALVYSGALTRLIAHDWKKGDYSHCWLIPLIAIYLIWDRRNDLTGVNAKATWKGFIPLGIGIFLFWLGELGGEYFTLYMSLWFVIVGLLWMHVGWQKIKIIWFPLVMMLAAFPLPDFFNVRISFNLKLISSKLGVKLLQLYGMSAYQEGNIIDLGFTQLQVVDACNGLRYLIPLFILAILLAYFFKGPLWKKAVIVISSIPLSIVTNSFRIALTGIIHELLGEKMAEGFFHGFSGWFIFIASLVILLAEMKVLGFRQKVSGVAFVSKSARDNGIKKGKLNGGEAAMQNSQFKIHNSKGIVAILLLGATLAFSHGMEFREKTPIKKSFDYFPVEVTEWSGKRNVMEQKFIDALDFSDYVIVDYKDKADKQVNFYAAYYESQRKGESIHSPETCLPGSGWEFREAGSVSVPTANGNAGNMKVNRAMMIKPGVRQLVYFWFPQRGRVLTNAYQLKLYAFWDALTRQRTDGALVRIITPVYPNEQLKDAEARLQGFTREIMPVLSEFIPE